MLWAPIKRRKRVKTKDREIVREIDKIAIDLIEIGKMIVVKEKC
jgi:hypothetical protein